MASSQVHQFSDKEKAAIEEAMKEAQSFQANNIKNAKASQDKLVLVSGAMKNLQSRALRLHKSHSWKGVFVAGPSETMATGVGAFVHEGTPWQGQLPMVVGSKGVVIYGHYDKALPQLGWLLAWDKPTHVDNGISKVYVEAGHLTKLMEMELAEIEKKLDESRSISRYWDSETGAAASAKIENAADNMALVGATFDQFFKASQS
ncbi:jasmonate-induced protein homolog [Chenopodium quinoa]|uniref:jasmonate-induced protein homolog n=1 Tax=Chenopodium quinoa TaxID=63459 RepID=UPI000B780207|nr:jasmonate-induced protein homolog [Chenopodium quinoa]